MKKFILVLLFFPTLIFAKGKWPTEGEIDCEKITIECVPEVIRHAGARGIPSFYQSKVKTKKDISFDRAVEIAKNDPEITHFTFITLKSDKAITIKNKDLNLGFNVGLVNLYGHTAYFFKGKPEFQEVKHKGKNIGHSYIVHRKES